MTVKEALDRRPEYMSGKITHHDYYKTIGECIRLKESDLPCSIKRVKTALSIGDEHLNTIPLKLWDMRHEYIVSILKRCRGIGGVSGVFVWSLSDTVCTLKAIAKHLASK